MTALILFKRFLHKAISCGCSSAETLCKSARYLRGGWEEYGQTDLSPPKSLAFMFCHVAPAMLVPLKCKNKQRVESVFAEFSVSRVAGVSVDGGAMINCRLYNCGATAHLSLPNSLYCRGLHVTNVHIAPGHLGTRQSRHLFPFCLPSLYCSQAYPNTTMTTNYAKIDGMQKELRN